MREDIQWGHKYHKSTKIGSSMHGVRVEARKYLTVLKTRKGLINDHKHINVREYFYQWGFSRKEGHTKVCTICNINSIVHNY